MAKFFKSTSGNIDDELAEIDPSKYQMDFGPILPGEELIGEMNDFEKRAAIWMVLMVEKTKDDLGRLREQMNDQEAMMQWNREALVDLSKISLLNQRVSKSLSDRFEPGKTLFYRGNFQIVRSNRSEQEIMDDLQKIEAVAKIEVNDAFEGRKHRPI